MGFFEDNAEELAAGGGNYVNEDEKKVLAEEGVSFPLLEVTFEPDNMYQGSARPRYVVKTEIDGEERLMSLGLSTTANPSSRDRLLKLALNWLEDDKEPFEVKFEKIGRYFNLIASE